MEAVLFESRVILFSNHCQPNKQSTIYCQVIYLLAAVFFSRKGQCQKTSGLPNLQLGLREWRPQITTVILTHVSPWNLLGRKWPFERSAVAWNEGESANSTLISPCWQVLPSGPV